MQQQYDARGRAALLALTLSRIPLALVLFAMFLIREPGATEIVVGTVLLVLIELSDFLDGQLARRRNLISELGATLDPYADSVARFLTYFALAEGGLALMLVPVCMALRDITVAYSRIIVVRAGRSASAKISGKLKAGVQAAGAFVLLMGPLYWRFTGEGIMPVLSYIIGVLTLVSGVEYVVGALRIVSTDHDASS
ncbi:MAG: CDP-alcohol phosphatidyltransferase family protein [Spirochaetota bacterium]